jgi:protein gp37
MSATTKIQWTDHTWNPVSGCSKVSAGCKNCYAERDWARLSRNPKSPYFGRDFTDVRCHPERLDQPLRWRLPRRIFVNSMSDLFHEDVPDEFIVRVFNIMASATADCGKRHEHEEECWQGDHHTFQILTKRPERMCDLVRRLPNLAEEFLVPDDVLSVALDAGLWPLRNVQLGVSVEDREQLARLDTLRGIPNALSWCSFEPLLEDLGDLSRYRWLKWSVWGGESGPGARPCDINWIRRGMRQLPESAHFVKQLGSYAAEYCEGCGVSAAFHNGREPGPHWIELRDRKGGDPSEWPEDLRVREYPG